MCHVLRYKLCWHQEECESCGPGDRLCPDTQHRGRGRGRAVGLRAAPGLRTEVGWWLIDSKQHAELQGEAGAAGAGVHGGAGVGRGAGAQPRGWRPGGTVLVTADVMVIIIILCRGPPAGCGGPPAAPAWSPGWWWWRCPASCCPCTPSWPPPPARARCGPWPGSRWWVVQWWHVVTRGDTCTRHVCRWCWWRPLCTWWGPSTCSAPSPGTRTPSS